MVNYVLSFCKITAASRIFSRNFYLPLLKPLTPKEALRTFRITGKWLLGAKIQHYIPVLMNHRKKRSKRLKNYGKIVHNENDDYTYMSPILDSDNESHKLLLNILEGKDSKQKNVYVYTVEDKRYNIVLASELENAIRDGDVIDVLVSQRTDKIIVKLKNFKKIPIEIQYYEGDNSEQMFCGEGATSPDEEKFHHHGKYTMSIAKMFEDKELLEDKWEEELRKIIRRRKRQAKEGSKEWKEMVKESMKGFDWQKFEEDAKKVIDEISEPAVEESIDMEIDDLETTKNVNETILKRGPDMLNQLPTMTEIPEIIRSMGSATLHEIEEEDDEDEDNDDDDDESREKSVKKRRVSGVKVKLPSGKECFISGQIVHTEDGDVFVPGQTIENEYGLEYAPGITINVNNKPTLISGLIMGAEEQQPMFLPTQSTITADGQLTFANAPEERPQLTEEQKLKKKQKKMEEIIEEVLEEKMDDDDIEISDIEDKSLNDLSSIELNNSEIEELDIEAMRLKQEQQRLELEKLKAILQDDGLDELIASLEDKNRQLKQKLEELRKLNINTDNNLVTYISEENTKEIAMKITQDDEIINRLAEVLMTITRRAATFRDRNSINPDNINQAFISVPNPTESDLKFNNSCNKLKLLLKTVAVAANDVFKNRPKDQLLALNSIGEIIVDILKSDDTVLKELLEIMNTTALRNEICNSIFKQLTQNVADTKVSILTNFAQANWLICDAIETVEKILGKESETKCDAFTKIAKNDPKIINLLVKEINTYELHKVTTEDEAVEILDNSIGVAIRKLNKINLEEFLKNNKNVINEFKEDVIGFAKALGLDKIAENIEQSSRFTYCDKQTNELLERVLLIRLLADKDYSLKTAMVRLKKNPERARSDPRIRQLIRESAVLISQQTPLKSSRDIPLQLVKNENLLAIEDFLLQREKIEYPILISRNSFQAVIPKEAARGVLAGRVNYILLDESGKTKFKPMHMFSAINVNKNREKRIDDYLNGGVRRGSSDDDGNRTYLQAKTNVRKLKKLFNNSREVA